jgi:hypothetical protein
VEADIMVRGAALHLLHCQPDAPAVQLVVFAVAACDAGRELGGQGLLGDVVAPGRVLEDALDRFVALVTQADAVGDLIWN